MRDYDKQLEELQEQIAKKKSEEAILEDLRKQQKELEDRLYELECQKKEEQEDVEELEQGGVFNLFLKVTGQMKALIEEERREANEALERYEAACNELEMVKKDIKYHETEYGRVRRSEENYELTLKQKAESLKETGTPEAERIERIEERLMQLEEQEKEINHVISVYNTINYLVEDMEPLLSRAEGWSKWDLFTDTKDAEIGKYYNLDKAQEHLRLVQKEHAQLEGNLNYVKVPQGLSFEFDFFVKFMDYVLDNFFVDLSVLKYIQESHSRLTKYGEEVESFLIQLNAMLTRTSQAQNQLKGERDRLVRGLQA